MVAEYVDMRYDYYTMAENNKKNQNRKMQIDSLLDYPIRKTTGSSGKKRSGSSSAQKQNAGRTTGKRSGNAVRRTGTTGSSSRKTSAGTETEAQRRERLRRNRERQALRKKRRKRKKIIRMALAVVAVSALAAILITGGAAIHRYRVKKAEAEAAAAAAEEAARTLDTFRASDVLHLSFPTLTIKDSDPEDESSADGTEDGTADADGDGIPDETADTGETADDAAETSSDSSADSSAEQALSVNDFNQILSDLYEQNYVLVDVYSLAASGDNGFTDGSVQVPKGKKPLIISQTDCSYTTEDDGKADSLVLDSKSGKILCQYTEKNENDGSTDSLTGAVDVIPCLENFISQHPDFSYNGARGIIGITGYRGLFGYTVEKDENVIAAPTVTISPSTQNVTYSEDDQTQNGGDGSGTTDTGTGTDESGTTDTGTGTDESGTTDTDTGTDYTDGTGTDAYGTADDTYASATTEDKADGMFAFAYPDNPVITGFLKNTGTDRGLASVLTAGQEGAASEEDTTAENTDTSGTGGGTSGTTESAESSSVSSVSSSSSDSLTNNEQVSRNLQTCQSIISALRSSGWRFACNSYDLTSYGSQYDIMKSDVDQWEDVFSSILGTTDIMLFPKKTDIGDWGVYTADNQKYSYLNSLGFHYYFIENSGELTWAQVQPGYVRQGIHEIDSYADYLEVLK